MYYGSAAHAEQVTYGRHPGVKDALQWLTFAHLPEPLQRFSRPFYGAACEVIETILTDGPELTTCLNTIVNAKDAAVRAGIRHDTGRAGSVPRPQEVTEPPTLSSVYTTERCPLDSEFAGVHGPHGWRNANDPEGVERHCPGDVVS